MTIIAKRAFPAALAALAVTACSAPGQFPSLARRPAEGLAGRVGGSAAPAPPAPGTSAVEVPVAADLAGRLRDLEAAARTADARFAGQRGRAAALVAAARGAAAGSEAWSAASVAVAELQSARSDAVVSLGELDRLYAEDRINGGDAAAIASVRDRVSAWVTDETTVLTDLGNQLSG